MEEKIIELLKKSKDYISGEEISSQLKVSRQALWKHIQELKELGYEITAVPHLGYKLVSVPDKLFDFEVRYGLNTKILGKKILYFDSLNSTMDMAAQLGINGIGEGTVILAETQDKGRGRLGREWFSPKYKGLYLSILLRPRVLPSEASILTLLVAVSICEAIKEVSGIEPQIKWPNDILVHNRKLGGILTEINAETDKINFVTIGIGINVNNEKRSLISGATSLKEIRKEEVSRIQLLRELLRRIEANYLNLDKKGSFVIAEKWRQHSMTLGKRVRVYCQSRQIEGEALDIENDGSLLLRKDSGITVKVTSGDVVHCR